MSWTSVDVALRSMQVGVGSIGPREWCLGGKDGTARRLARLVFGLLKPIAIEDLTISV